MKQCILLIMTMSILMAACTSVQVRPLDKSQSISHICIKKNSKVKVLSFLSVVRNRFEDHGISSNVFNESRYVTEFTTGCVARTLPFPDNTPLSIHKMISKAYT